MKTGWLVLLLISALTVPLINSCVTAPEVRERRGGIEQGVFFEAVRNGSYAEVQRMIEAGADVNAKDSHGYTALMLAAEKGYTEIVRLLVEEGADVGARDNSGRSACNRAFSNGNREIVQLLVPPGLKHGKGQSLVHVHSGAVFEEFYENFIRSCSYNYDSEGRDVGVGYVYMEESFHMWATLYVYPTGAGAADPDLLRSHYRQVKNDVYRVNRDVVQVLEQEDIFNFPSGDRFGLMAGFNLKMQTEENMMSFLFLFGEDNWFVLFRISYPAVVHGSEAV
jgi:hypothetical protein